jgi:hypothetical protein
MLAAGALAATVLAAAAAVGPGPTPGPPRAQRFATPQAAIAAALDETHFAGGVVAFGELHQTLATAEVPSALKRFTEQLFPGLAGRLSQLVVETWLTTGRCGEAEKAVTADVQRTTERPAQTETEIETLLRLAQASGVRPSILTIGCQDYQAMRAGGGVDYDRTLRVTAGALEAALARALRAAAVSARTTGPRLVAVYGGALHNDLHPEPELAAYSFAAAALKATLGHYVEVDLVVPEYAEGSAAVKAQSWWRAYRAARRPGVTTLVRRDARSFVVVFPGTASGKPAAGGISKQSTGR